ncbi:hypothetical protein V1514DRAFT_309540 [Lipomyces japonicus]|uniref:uncharacterized protein n=1 Tax=Lipomyces japonicus TaxID=56871 RepID=UPI0034CDAB59
MIQPDDLVEYIIEEIAFDGAEGATISRLWELLSKREFILDDHLRNLIWTWLCDQKDRFLVGITSDTRVEPLPNNEVRDLASLIAKFGDTLRVTVAEDILWTVLTGLPKNENSVGAYPFALLCVITRSREKGITAIEAARYTKQDPRSLFSRINTLAGLGLIKKFPVSIRKNHTTMLINSRFFQSTQVSKMTEHYGLVEGRVLDGTSLQRDILEQLKIASNGIRQRNDLRKQLSLDTSKMHFRLFSRSVRLLIQKGAIRRVYVIRASDSSHTKHLCLQYVRDLTEESIKDEIKDEDITDDDESKDISENEETTRVPLELGGDVQIEEARPGIMNSASFNRFYPLETQLYDIISSSGETGVSTMDMTRLSMGRSYGKVVHGHLLKFAKTDESKSSQPKYLADYTIIRVEDQSSKRSFLRYFNLPSYRKFCSQAQDEYWGNFSPLPHNSYPQTILELQKMPDCIRAVHSIVKEHIVPKPNNPDFETSLVYGKKRGRPRKDALDTPRSKKEVPLSHSPAVSTYAVTEQENAANIPNNSEAQNHFVHPTTTLSTDRHSVSNDKDMSSQRDPAETPHSSNRGLGMPIAALQRQEMILKLLSESGGVMEGGVVLKKRLTDLNSGITIDKKTTARDISSLIDRGKIQQICIVATAHNGRSATVWIYTYPHLTVDSPEVVKFKNNILSSREEKPKRFLKNIQTISHEFDFYYLVPQQSLEKQKIVQDRVDAALRESTAQSTALTDEQRRIASERLKVRHDNIAGEGIIQPPRRRKLKHVTTVRPALEVQGLPSESNIAPEISVLHRIVPSEQHLRKRSRRKRTRTNDDPISKYVRPGKKFKSIETAEAKKRRNEEYKKKSEIRKIVRNSVKLTSEDADLIYRTVIVVRSFYGGLTKAIDWDRVASSLVPTFTKDMIVSAWTRVRKRYGGANGLKRATDRWEYIFLEAYEKGAIPQIDFENIDIKQLVEMWQENDVQIFQDEDSVGLLTSIERSGSIDDYVFVRDEQNSYWLDEVHSAVSSVKFEESFSSVPFSVAATGTKDNVSVKSKEIDRVKQVIKSIIATDNSKYQPDKAKSLLDSFGPEICSEAVGVMEKEKTLVYTSRDLGKRIPGRNFIFSEKFNSLSKVRTGEDSLQKTLSFHVRLQNTFAENKGIIMSRLAPDSSMICLIDLIARNQVELVRVNVNTGKLIEGYASRLVDRDKLDCDIVLRNSIHHKIASLEARIVDIPVSYDNENQVIPGARIWVDVFGEINKYWFMRLANVILMAINLRPGIPTTELCRRHAGVLTSAETNDIVEWLRQKQLVRINHSKENGLWVQEGWYNSEQP